MVIRNFKNRAYPNQIQIKEFEDQQEFLRIFYNAALSERINYYKKFNKNISYNEQSKYLSEIKELFPEETKNIHSQVLQQCLKKLDRAFQAFFRRIKKGETPGFPRFKKFKTYKSLLYPQPLPDLSRGCVKLTLSKTEKRAKLKLSGFTGEFNVKLHRPLEGNCKQVMIKRNSTGKFFVIFCCDNVSPKTYPTTGKVVGIDLGITNFMTLDGGKVFHHPKPYKTAKEKLAYEQRKLSLKQKGSKNREKQKLRVAKLHEHIVNIREDFQHKISTRLLDEYDHIIVEDLNIKSMLENKGYEVNKQNITDAAWGGVLNMLNYKAESASNKTLTKVNPYRTSMMCASCLFVKKERMPLDERIFYCDECGARCNRDKNAAKNIKRLGISRIDSNIY